MALIGEPAGSGETGQRIAAGHELSRDPVESHVTPVRADGSAVVAPERSRQMARVDTRNSGELTESNGSGKRVVQMSRTTRSHGGGRVSRCADTN